MPEKVTRINFCLYLHKPIEVVLEIFVAPFIGLSQGCIVLLVHTQIKISIIYICSSWRLGNIWSHVVVEFSDPLYVSCFMFISSLPWVYILNFEQVSFSVGEWDFIL
ncbi:hypothetical protein IC582_029072 [Cucumis melo]